MSFSFQISNFSGSLYGAEAAVCAFTELLGRVKHQTDSVLVDEPIEFVAETSSTNDLVSDGTLRAWMPSVEDLVASVDLSKPESTSIRNFGNFVSDLAQSQMLVELDVEPEYRVSISEQALTLEDFRHAVDHKISYESSLWSNNN